ncbi:MAG TPA: ABC transporter substrate-binding protein [Vineibacter sp.]|nr:ABC transporter substrate-binding protein [Vineibacter sp.]
MRRRQIAAALAAFVVPRAVVAQAVRRRRLAIMVTAASDAEVSENGIRFFRAFFAELRRLDYVEDRTLIVERWSGHGVTARYSELAREIVSSKPDVIFAVSTRLARALQAATTSIPIVAFAGNMVGAGLADSLSRPGHNVTGVSAVFGVEIQIKRLEMLRDAIPAATRIGFLVPRNAWDTGGAREVREAAPRLGMTLIGALLDDPVQASEYRRVLALLPEQRVDALYVFDAGENFVHRQLIVELAMASRLPTIGPWRELPEADGLMSFGADLGEAGRILAGYVARTLQGERPENLPIRLLDKFEVVVNLKTARALNLTIPAAILVRADQVIE